MKLPVEKNHIAAERDRHNALRTREGGDREASTERFPAVFFSCISAHRHYIPYRSPFTVTGKALVELLRESNLANREVTIDMATFNRDLQQKLDDARKKIDSLQDFFMIAVRKIGNFEGMLRANHRFEITSDEVNPLINAWSHYEETTMTKKKSRLTQEPIV